MPSHPDRVRTASLPKGYQFGDACKTRFASTVADSAIGISLRFIRQFDADADRRKSLSFSAEELIRWGRCMERARLGWNVIEGDHGVYSGQGDEA